MHPQVVLKRKRENLIESFLKGKVKDFQEAYTDIIDEYFYESFKHSSVGPLIDISRNPYAIVALGGYGRREECVYSDLDILILFKKKVLKKAERLVQELIYPLWDIGLEVGHATRSIGECVSISLEEMEVATSLLDARFLCGVSKVYTDFKEAFRKKVIDKRPEALIKEIVNGSKARHEIFGDSTYLLEPNIKDGQGGLRDYHTMLWLTRIKNDIQSPRELEFNGLLTHDEYNSMMESLNFIWLVRNRLHQITGRKYDRLLFGNQEELADALNYKKVNGVQPVELFLGDLHGRMNLLKQHYLMFIREVKTMGPLKSLRNKMKKSISKGLSMKKNMLYFAFPESLQARPSLLMKIFEESAQNKVPLSMEARRLIRDYLHLVDEDFRNDGSMIKIFEKILAEPMEEFSVLNDMLTTGFLGAFIPEFGLISNRIQFDEYHLYPVDKHSLRTVQTVNSFGSPLDSTGEKLCGAIYGELKDKSLLLWAALLHDIGKGEPGKNHSMKGAGIVRNILKEKGKSPEDIEAVFFLVKEHLLLALTATRRDIHDEETAVLCARRIGDPELLKMLYLLTVADSASTGPKAWNSWIGALLREFFINVDNVLVHGKLATPEAISMVENKQKSVLKSAANGEERERFEPVLKKMSRRYYLYTKTEDIPKHISLYYNRGEAGLGWRVDKTPGSNHRIVTLCLPDKPGIFSKIAGCLTLHNMNILSADIFTWRNNMALDIIKVTPPLDPIFENEVWDRFHKDLADSLMGKLDLAKALKSKVAESKYFKPRRAKKGVNVVVDNHSSAFYTIIEVFAHDFLGLLFMVTDTLFKNGLDIWVAKIATDVDRVVDVFYVRDVYGEKVDDPEKESAIIDSLLSVLPSTNSQISIK